MLTLPLLLQITHVSCKLAYCCVAEFCISAGLSFPGLELGIIASYTFVYIHTGLPWSGSGERDCPG